MTQTKRNGEEWSSAASGGMSDMASAATAQARDIGEKAVDAASEAGRMVHSTAREYPVTTGLLIAGVAFALGALWKSGSYRRNSVYGYLDRINDAMGDMPRRYWRQMT